MCFKSQCLPSQKQVEKEHKKSVVNWLGTKFLFWRMSMTMILAGPQICICLAEYDNMVEGVRQHSC